MCSYNGAAFIADQLHSFAKQTRLPDEVVICDDRSSDATCDIISSLELPFPIRLYVNEQNLGTTSNFAKAIGLCTGDVIVLSDQDDVWLPEKLDIIGRAFQANKNLGLFASDAAIVDMQLKPLHERFWEVVAFGDTQRHQFHRAGAVKALTSQCVILGAAAAFDAKLRDVILPIPISWYHDYWIAFVTAALADVSLYSNPLILYRRHAAQQVGPRHFSFWKQIQIAKTQDNAYFKKLAESLTCLRERLESVADRVVPGAIDLVRSREEMAIAQAEMRAGSHFGRIPMAARQFMKSRYFLHGRGTLGWKSLAADLFL